jgi:hypothetical protein
LISGDSSSVGTTWRWMAAASLGLISSTFSTVVSQLSAGRIGRDALVDWMSVAAIPAREWALTAEPSFGAIAVGIAFHQWADFSWALVSEFSESGPPIEVPPGSPSLLCRGPS